MATQKKGVILQFPTLSLLWHFAQELKSKDIHINTWERQLICDCREDEINLALTAFKARILEGTVSRATA
jgi:hypothetical protein